MSEYLTLNSIFQATKGELAASLSGKVLPKDSGIVQSIITEYLNKVCDENSDYRQNLTQSEDYILQAALSMLNAQRELVAAFDYTPSVSMTSSIEADSPKETSAEAVSPKQPSSKLQLNPTTTFVGVGGGALVGKLLLGGWGAVFGAIAGTAVAMYLSQRPQPASSKRLEDKLIEGRKVEKVNVEIKDTPIDTPALLSVIGQICDGLDNLISTFRAQIKRVVNKYESQEKPTIEREYRVLLEGIQSLIGYKRGHSPEEEKYLSKLQTRVEDLAELLDNYDLEAVDYTPEHSEWFEAIESKNATEIKLVAPAIIKNGALVVKGKIFTPTI